MLIHTAVTPKIPVLADAAAEAPLDVEEAPLDVEDAPLDVEDAPHDVEEAPHDVPLDVEEAPHDVEDALAGADVEDVVCKKVPDSKEQFRCDKWFSLHREKSFG